MVIRMRHTRGHTRNRRSHHALKAGSLGVCEQCGTKKSSHMACYNCGSYKGRAVINVQKKLDKKTKKAKADKK